MRLGLIVVFLLLTVPCTAGTVFVDDSAALPGDGLSWASAYTDLQDALDAARFDPTIDAIHVAAGLYLPDRGTMDVTRSFEIVDGVALLGGFPNGGGPIESRDRDANETILSGDLVGDDGPLNQFGGWSGQNNNAMHVVRATACGPATHLDGFVIHRGYANGGGALEERVGGNMLIHGGSPTIVNCRFERGRSEWGGGGIAAVESAPLIDACEFHENIGANTGGGIGIYGTIAADIRNCLFNANIGGSGIGVYCGGLNIISGDGNATMIRNCDFVDNLGVIGANTGGGIFCLRGNNTITHCRFRNNKTNGGGGIGLSQSDAYVEGCTFVGNRGDEDGGGAILAFKFDTDGPISNVDVVSCLIVGNNGGIFGIRTNVNVVNCTIAHNEVLGIPIFITWPALLSQDADFTLSNSIVWGNQDRNFFGGARDFLSGDPLYTLADCFIEDWDGSLAGDAIATNPMFTDESGPDGDPLTIDDNDYTLRLDSPALDAGDNAALRPDSLLDAGGNARVKDGDADGNTTIDIGALERCTLDSIADGCDLLGDTNGDGAVDQFDISQFVVDVLAGSESTLSDLNRDGKIDGDDIAPFVGRLLPD